MLGIQILFCGILPYTKELKIDGYEVKFCRQLQNKKMANIISELLEEDASNPV